MPWQQTGCKLPDNARVITTDVMATNGVIHVFDSVILPK
ncbi:MAG: fasciclin domain-containing protein [Planctomycetota bacterium]